MILRGLQKFISLPLQCTQTGAYSSTNPAIALIGRGTQNPALQRTLYGVQSFANSVSPYLL